MTVETYRHSGGIGALGIPLMCLGGGLTTVEFPRESGRSKSVV